MGSGSGSGGRRHGDGVQAAMALVAVPGNSGSSSSNSTSNSAAEEHFVELEVESTRSMSDNRSCRGISPLQRTPRASFAMRLQRRSGWKLHSTATATMMSLLVVSAAGNVSIENHFLVWEEATALSF